MFSLNLFVSYITSISYFDIFILLPRDTPFICDSPFSTLMGHISFCGLLFREASPVPTNPLWSLWKCPDSYNFLPPPVLGSLHYTADPISFFTCPYNVPTLACTLNSLLLRGFAFATPPYIDPHFITTNACIWMLRDKLSIRDALNFWFESHTFLYTQPSLVYTHGCAFLRLFSNSKNRYALSYLWVSVQCSFI